MGGLTAKVFRTYNASITLEKELDKAFDENFRCAEVGEITPDSTTDNKVYFYNQANTRVAVLCNHQKTVSKNFDEQMEKLEAKLLDKEENLKRLKRELKWAKGKGKPAAKWKKKSPEQVKKSIEKAEHSINKLKLQTKMKTENKEVALGTSKINYMDPRITISFCKK